MSENKSKKYLEFMIKSLFLCLANLPVQLPFLFLLGKYKDCFLNPTEQKDYVFPFLNIDDPYEASKEDILRAKWIQEQKVLYGEFKPAL